MTDKITILSQVHSGSRCYGTNTPESDIDYKGVHLPSIKGLLCHKPEEVRDFGVKVSDAIKNTNDDTDYQSFSLNKFLNMVAQGDTVAIEILFAPLADNNPDPRWEKVRAFAKTLINRECKGFVGYCQRQASKYGVKGTRMKECQQAMEFFENWNPRLKLNDIVPEIEEFIKDKTFMNIIDIRQSNGDILRHFECVDRKVPFTNFISVAHDLFEKTYENYGERARAAMNNESTDWKATAHAVRIAEQAIELLTTGHITFPRPNAAYLLEIRQGKHADGSIPILIEQLLEDVEKASISSVLPEITDVNMINDFVYEMHLDHILDKTVDMHVRL